jgi:trimeric autotransporter adhesin
MRLFSALICFAAVACAQTSTPAITSISPNPIDAGGPAFTITVNVSSSVSGAVVNWSGTPLATTAVSNTSVTASVPANLIAICGKYSVTLNNAQNVALTSSFPVIVKPVLTSLSPSVLSAGSGGVTVTANGLGFSSNVYLTLLASGTQSNLATTYGGSNTLSAYVPPTALTGNYPVSLFVADLTTNAVSQTLPITLTVASVASIDPNNIPAGSSTFTLNVVGANFVYGAQVLFNSTPLTTIFNGSSNLTATVPANLVHDAGSYIITVKNPGASSASNSLRFIATANPFGTTITSLSPPSAVAGGPAVTLTVTGERFTQQSTVLWVDFRTPLPTTFVSSTQLTAIVPVNLVATDGVAPITVSTPGVAISNSVNFPIIAVSPTIANNGISPTSAVAGGPAFTMTVNGDGFILASQVIGLTGATTTYVSLNQLTVSVPASAIATAGQHSIQVVSPGGIVSPQAPLFTVKAAAPTASLASLSPSSATPGGDAFTLTLNGANFPANSKVQWNGAPLTTTFVSASQLTAAVPTALIAAAGTASVTVTGDGGTSNALAFTITAQVVPATTSAGIVNDASFLPAIAPGTLIAIFGSNLATTTAQFSTTPLPTSLGNTSVSINGTNVPLLYVSPTQVNAQVPYETKVGTAQLIVQSNGLPSPAVNFQVAATGPGVFTTQQNNHVLALNLADGSLNASQTPAQPGQYVTAYLTGQGLVDPAVTTGDVAPASPFSLPNAPVQVKIGGVLANVQFAGLAPGFVDGLLQMNIQIPDVPAGDLPFDVSVGGVAAATTTISIASKQ